MGLYPAMTTFSRCGAMYQDMSSQSFDVSLAAGPEDLRAAQALRYDVFVEEGGASIDTIHHTAGLEADAYDQHADHLLLRDLTLPKDRQVVGTYRLMTRAQAAAAGRFYSQTEFDLSQLLASGQNVLELGRSCLRKSYRGGTALLHMWRGLGQYVADHDIDILFGVASLPGTDLARHHNTLSYLFDAHAAPTSLTVTSLANPADTVAALPAQAIDRRAALTQMPALIKSYLRLGGVVGQGAYVDHAFNTIDVCLILEARRLTARHRALFEAA